MSTQAHTKERPKSKPLSIAISPQQHSRMMLDFNRVYGCRPDGVRVKVALEDGSDATGTTLAEAWMTTSMRAVVGVIHDDDPLKEARMEYLANVKPIG